MTQRTLILGLGNVLLADESVGAVVVGRLRPRRTRPRRCCSWMVGP